MANEKRLIDANAFIHAYEFIKKHIVAGDSEFLQGYEAGLLGAYNAINQINTVDAVEVVRCKDCKHYDKDALWCNINSAQFAESRYLWYEEDFCSMGERKTDNE